MGNMYNLCIVYLRLHDVIEIIIFDEMSLLPYY
jgi:hypothetical protein